jgi:nickel-type superoxide dismutase maturation protease
VLKRVLVEGPSMLPTLRPRQRLIVATRAYRRRAPKIGHIVLVSHPQRTMTLIKRVVGPVKDGKVHVRGDNPAASTDSDHFGPVSVESLKGRVLFSYWPLRRIR